MAQRAVESILVNADAATIFDVVCDFERYHEWVDDLKRIDILERDSEGRPLEVEFRAAAFGRSTTYTLRYDYHGAPNQLDWHQTSGDLTETMTGQYRFEGVAVGTRVTYELEVELRVPIPAFIRARAAHRIQTQALRELRARAEQRR